MKKDKKQLIIAFIAILSISGLCYHLHRKYYPYQKKDTYHLSIVAAHNNSVRHLVLPFVQKKFKEKYGEQAELQIDWIKHGGQNANMKVVNQAFQKNDNQTCGYDLIWGGGERAIYQLHKEGKLASFSREHVQEIPPTLAHLTLYNRVPGNKSTWVTVSLSSFGCIYNKEILEREHISIPDSWEALAQPCYFGKVSSADPTLSSVQWVLFTVIRQQYGLERAWQIYAGIAANTIRPLEKSSAATESVVRGNALAAPAIDYYGMRIVERIGADGIGFVYTDKILINRDLIAILKGAPNQEMALFFINCVLSTEYQRLQMLKKGTLGGPVNYTLGRIAISENAYKTAKESDIGSAINPFTTHTKLFKIDPDLMAKGYEVWSAALQCYFVKAHTHFREAWKLAIDHGSRPEDIALLTRLPFDEQQAEKFSKKWKDPSFRAAMKTKWENDCINRSQQIFDKYKND